MPQQSSIQYSLPTYEYKKHFIITLILLQIIIISIYAAGVLKVQVHNDEESIAYNYPSFVDLSTLIVLGGGLLNVYIKTYMYGGVISNLMIYCIAIQFLFLFQGLWFRVFGKQLFGRNFPGNDQYLIYFRQQDYTLAVYACSAVTITFGIIFGRVGLFQKLIITIILMFTFVINVVLLNQVFKIYDVGGSIFGHTFGCYFGLALSAVLARYRQPITRIQPSYQSVILGFMGCFLIFINVPSINSQYLTQTPFQKSIVIMNSILSMCCSVVSAFAMSVFLKKKFSAICIFDAALCGSIGAGSSLGLFVNPCACMLIGWICGIVCFLGIQYLSGYLETRWKIYDTFCVHNVRGIPGIIGGLAGAVAIALSSSIPEGAKKQLHFYSNSTRSIGHMVGFQILGLLCTLALSITSGMLTGFLITRFYNIDSKHFFRDVLYFQLPKSQLKQYQINNLTKDSINNPQQEIVSDQIPNSATQFKKQEQQI